MRFSFKKDLIFIKGTRTYTLVRRLLGGTIQLEADDGQLLNQSEYQLLQGVTNGEWSVDTNSLNKRPEMAVPVTRDLVTYSPQAQEKAKERYEYLKRLMDEEGRLITTFDGLNERILVLAKEFNHLTPPSVSAVYRWYKRFTQSGHDITALADKHEQRGRKTGITPNVQAILDEVVDTLYLNVQMYPKKGIFEELERRITNIHETNPEQRLHYPMPSMATVYRYLDKLDSYLVDSTRLGKDTAERKYRGVFQKNLAYRINEWWEIDHTPLDLLVVCEETDLPLGRPWMTLALDKYSRMPVGFYISFRSPSAQAVMECIKQAVLPKDEILKRYPDITLPWKAQGLPERIVCDNGMDLHAEAFKNMCQEMGIQVQYCPAARPEYKGSVERFFRTINHSLIHMIPGTVFSDIDERGDYPSEKQASITLDALTHVIVKWIVEVYSQEQHKGMGITPAMKWEQGMAERILEYPVQPDKLDVITGHPEQRRVFHYGIELHGLYYNSPELQLLRRRFGDPFHLDIKYYEGDIGHIHVFDKSTKHYFKVYAIDQAYAKGLRLMQHQLITRQVRSQGHDPKQRKLLLQKKYELQQLIQASTTDRKMKRRKKAAVLSGVDMKGKPIQEWVEALPSHLALSDELPDYDVTYEEVRGARHEIQ